MTLTQSDLSKIGQIVDQKLEEKFDLKFDGFKKEVDHKLDNFKDELVQDIDNRLQDLKSDFYERIDPILKEVVTSREERPLIENRLEALEEIHQTGQHSIVN